MFSLFKSKPETPVERTLKRRAELFWEWYAGVAARFYQAIEEKKARDLVEEVSAKVNDLFPGMAWVFGPGAEGKGHSLTLSGEGVVHQQLVALYAVSRAPSLPGWTFYASRQPGRIDGMVMDIGKRRFDPVEFWITPRVDAEAERIDLTAFHPLFNILDEDQRWTIFFLFLDELLGEYGTQQWIGEIKFSEAHLADAIALKELPEFVATTAKQAGWVKYPPGEAYASYSTDDPQGRFLRDDVIAGTTSHFKLVTEYSNAKGELPDPLAGTGADFVFVSFAASFLPTAHQAEARGEIEDALEEALKVESSGRVLGGAHGTRNAYIDLMLYDGANSLEIVRRVMTEQGLPAGSEIHYFAKEKRGHRIVI